MHAGYGVKREVVFCRVVIIIGWGCGDTVVNLCGCGPSSCSGRGCGSFSCSGGVTPVGGSVVPFVAGLATHLLVDLVGAVLAQHFHLAEERFVRLTGFP